MEWFDESLSERILKMETEEEEEEEERNAADVDLDFLYASIIHAVVGGSERSGFSPVKRNHRISAVKKRTAKIK